MIAKGPPNCWLVLGNSEATLGQNCALFGRSMSMLAITQYMSLQLAVCRGYEGVSGNRSDCPITEVFGHLHFGYPYEGAKCMMTIFTVAHTSKLLYKVVQTNCRGVARTLKRGARAGKLTTPKNC